MTNTKEQTPAELFDEWISSNEYFEKIQLELKTPNDTKTIDVDIYQITDEIQGQAIQAADKTYRAKYGDGKLNNEDRDNKIYTQELAKEILHRVIFISGTKVKFCQDAQKLSKLPVDVLTYLINTTNQVTANGSKAKTPLTEEELLDTFTKLKDGSLSSENFFLLSPAHSQVLLLTFLVNRLSNALSDNRQLLQQLQQLTKNSEAES